jgi:hypothetical protein
VIVLGYNILDLIDKAINIGKKRKIIFENIGEKYFEISSISVMSRVLSKEVDKTIKYYESLKAEIGDVELDEIDFVVYDKMSFLLDEFSKTILAPEITNVKEYLKFSLELEKNLYSLIVDVQGRFVKCESDVNTKTYKVLADIINHKQTHIKSFEKILK